MRCRVGRKPTSRNIALTSCQGQPVSADRSGERLLSAIIVDVTTLRVGFIPFIPKRPAQQEHRRKNVSFATYTMWTARCNRFATGHNLRLIKALGGAIRHLCPLGLVCYQNGMGIRPGHLHGEKMSMEPRRKSFEYEDLLACGRGELFGAGNAQ